MTAATITTRVTQYEVSAIPEDDINHGHFTVTVEYRGDNQWAVLDRRHCLGADGKWDFEMRPSEREDEWLAAHRFDEQTALRLAADACLDMEVNGHTVADVLRRRAERGQA